MANMSSNWGCEQTVSGHIENAHSQDACVLLPRRGVPHIGRRKTKCFDPANGGVRFVELKARYVDERLSQTFCGFCASWRPMPVSFNASSYRSRSSRQWQTTVGHEGTRSVPQLMWWIVVTGSPRTPSASPPVVPGRPVGDRCRPRSTSLRRFLPTPPSRQTGSRRPPGCAGSRCWASQT